jgi:hypothetical protein
MLAVVAVVNILTGVVLMKKVNNRYELYGNPISTSQTRAADNWQAMFVKKFNYNPNEKYSLCLEDTPYLGSVFGLKYRPRGTRRENCQREFGRYQHHPHGFRTLSHCDGGSFLR